MPLYEALVRVKDKPLTGNDEIDCHRTRRGDVIAIKPAGEAWWTQAEREYPEWVILKLDIPEDLAKSSVMSQPPPDLTKEYRVLAKRGICLDLDRMGLPPPDSRRQDPPSTIGRAAVVAAVVVKEKSPEVDEIRVR